MVHSQRSRCEKTEQVKVFLAFKGIVYDAALALAKVQNKFKTVCKKMPGYCGSYFRCWNVFHLNTPFRRFWRLVTRCFAGRLRSNCFDIGAADHSHKLEPVRPGGCKECPQISFPGNILSTLLADIYVLCVYSYCIFDSCSIIKTLHAGSINGTHQNS